MIELGSYSVTIGSAPTKVSQTNRLRIANPIYIKGVNRIVMTPTTNYYGMMTILDADGIAIRNRSYYTQGEYVMDISDLPNATYLIFGFRKSDNTNMSTSEYNAVTYTAYFTLQSNISDNAQDIDSLKNITIGNFVDLGDYIVGELSGSTGEFDPSIVRKLTSNDFIPYDENLVIFNNTVGRTPQVNGYVVMYDSEYNLIPHGFGNLQLSGLFLDMSTIASYEPAYFKLCLNNLVAGVIPKEDVRTITRNIWCANKSNNLTQIILNSYGDFNEAINDLKHNSLIKSVAHQGYHKIYTANTVYAIKAAGLHGFDYAEFDVRLSSDGILIVNHDNDIYVNNNTMKISNASDPQATVFTLNQHTYAEIEQYTYNNSANPTATIPTLDMMLLACKTYGVKPYIEIVGAFQHVPDMCELVKKYGLAEDSVFSCGTSPQYYHPLILQDISKAKIAVQLRPGEPLIDIQTDIIANNGIYHYLYTHAQNGNTSIVRVYVSILDPDTTFDDILDFMKELRDIDIHVSVSRLDTTELYMQYAPYADYVLSNVYKATEIFN